MLDLLYALAAGSAILLGFLVVTTRRETNVLANRWLALFLVLLGIFMLDDSLVIFNVYPDYPWLIGFPGLTVAALAPSLFVSVSQFVSPQPAFRRRQLWHFLPFLVLLLLNTPFLLWASAEEKIRESRSNDLTTQTVVLLGLIIFQMVVYLFLSLQQLARHRRNLPNITATTEEVNLNWLWYFVYGVSLMALAWFIELWVVESHHNSGLFSLVYLTGIYAIGYFALRQKEVFALTDKEAREVVAFLTPESPPVEARKLVLNTAQLQVLKTRLLHHMDREQPYLDPDLNLPGLARQLGLTLHETSELINVGLGENFAQFVNRYRVEASKHLLLSAAHQHLSMVGIAFEAGFNSKTAFNTAFKKMTGMSPSEFKNTAGTTAAAVQPAYSQPA